MIAIDYTNQLRMSADEGFVDLQFIGRDVRTGKHRRANVRFDSQDLQCLISTARDLRRAYRAKAVVLNRRADDLTAAGLV